MQHRPFQVGIVGATGMVGQRLVQLLDNHPWFQVTLLAASSASAGRTYGEVMGSRWVMSTPIPEALRAQVIRRGTDIHAIANEVDFVFCAVNMDKTALRALEEDFARAETPVISNNSAHRGTPDVPVIIPEVNPDHTEVIPFQRKRLGSRQGFIVAKPNCSIQCYVPPLHALREFGLERVFACTYQSVSGAGKTLAGWPEMADNVIPFIRGEEEKSEQEPLKLWGRLEGAQLVPARAPKIGVQCLRVPVSDGHLAAVSVSFDRAPSREEILEAWQGFEPRPQELELPSAPKRALTYFEQDDRPQTRLDRDLERGMGFAIGRLRPDPLLDWRFVCLSHNTIRGAAGGSILTAELLAADGYLIKK